PTARHGIFPLIIGQRIYVAGGGSSAGGGTNIGKLEVYNPAAHDLYLPVVTSTPTPAATARPGERVFQESGGLVVAEAENAQAAISRGGFSWTARTDVAGYAGAAAMAAEPAGSTVIDTNYAASSPELRFNIRFATGGTYYVWARAWASDGSANSLHAGLDGAASPGADRLSSATFGAWAWFRTTLDGTDAQLTVGAGAHALNIWMREDGLRLDRVLLTTDPNYIPSGAGPAQSPLIEAAPTPTGATPTPVAPTPTGAAPTATPTASGGSAVRINAGGTTQAVDGVQWTACSSSGGCQGWVSGGFAYVQQPLPAISGSVAPANQAIYQTEWTGGQTNGVPEGGLAFRFEIPVGAGDYLVRLHFAELNKYSAGARVFDVRLEGATVLNQFDIWSAAGGANKAIVREFPLTVGDGAVTIEFIRRVENAKISAIEIVPATP
ncbi:MAG TPA: malectin domain-containing carbohydrate-binding protein, partial [Herpetosiphonaceae bacterium]|nr:malectin domain-containing carbohydrate-binding protein [Herpetosiphonaceae bacterium]